MKDSAALYLMMTGYAEVCSENKEKTTRGYYLTLHIDGKEIGTQRHTYAVQLDDTI
jgi:hypothetical protein